MRIFRKNRRSLPRMYYVKWYFIVLSDLIHCSNFRSTFESFISGETLEKTDEFDNYAAMVVESVQSQCCSNPQECRVLTLENDQHQEATIYRLEKGE